MRRADRRVPLERHLVFGFNDPCRACKSRVRVSHDDGVGAGRRRRAAHVLEQVFRCREGRGRRLFPIHLELPGRVDRLLFPLADDGHVVALADDFDESRHASHGRLVDAEQPRAGDGRLDVARVHHSGQRHPGCPLL